MNTKNESRVQYLGNGENTEYQTPFSVYIQTGVEVYFNSDKIDPQNYSVSLDTEKRATLIFNSAPANGVVITINRVLPILRKSSFQEGGALRASTLNYEFDYQMACLQDINELASRSMAYPPYAVDEGVNLTLPTPEAGKSIVWSADGTKLENSNVLVNELENTLKEYKTTAEKSAIIAEESAATSKEASLIAVEKAQEIEQKAQEVIAVAGDKLNSNIDNISSIGKENIAALIMPDYDNAVEITIPYTATKNGIILSEDHAGGVVHLDINNIRVFRTYAGNNTGSIAWASIAKGQIVTEANSIKNQFIPLKGEV